MGQFTARGSRESPTAMRGNALLCRLQAIGHDASHQIDGEVHAGAVLDVLNLAQLLELIEDGFRRRALAQPRDDINALDFHFLRKLPVGIALESLAALDALMRLLGLPLAQRVKQHRNRGHLG